MDVQIVLLDIPAEVWEVIFRYLNRAQSHRITFLSPRSCFSLYKVFLASKSPFCMNLPLDPGVDVEMYFTMTAKAERTPIYLKIKIMSRSDTVRAAKGQPQ